MGIAGVAGAQDGVFFEVDINLLLEGLCKINYADNPEACLGQFVGNGFQCFFKIGFR